LAMTRWVCSSGSPSRLVRWSKPTASSPGRTRAGHRRGRGGRPGARPGRRPPRPAQHDARTAGPGRWPDRPGRKGWRRSWWGAGPRQSRAPRRGRAGGPAARRWWGHGPRTWPGTRPPMLRPPALGCRRRRRTTGPGTRRGRTDTAGGRWPARGCSRPPGPPRELGDVGHHPAAPSHVHPARATPPLHCSSDDYRSSVERTATRHPLWQGAQMGLAVEGLLDGR
jgi:hypothetical protein